MGLSRWWVGRVDILIRVLYNVRCTSSGTGYKSVCISRKSPEKDLMAPVIGSAVVHCIWAIFFVTPTDPWMVLLVTSLYVGCNHTLAAVETGLSLGVQSYW